MATPRVNYAEAGACKIYKEERVYKMETMRENQNWISPMLYIMIQNDRDTYFGTSKRSTFADINLDS